MFLFLAMDDCPCFPLSVLRIICAARQAGRDYCSLTPKERPSPGDSRARPSSLPDAFRTWFSGCANTAKPPPRGNRSRRGRLYFARRGAHRISLGNCAQASVDNAWAFDQERGPLHQSAIRWEGRYAPRGGTQGGGLDGYDMQSASARGTSNFQFMDGNARRITIPIA